MASSDGSFGEYIYRERQKRGWTLREAAKHAGIAHSRLSEMESGVDTHSHKVFRPGYVHVIRLARVYELPPDELLRLAGHAPGAELAPEEWQIISAYRRLDVDGRDRLIALLEQLDQGQRSRDPG